jgi:hypothetical protein
MANTKAFLAKAEDHIKMIRAAMNDGDNAAASFSANHAIDCLQLLSKQLAPKFGVWISNLNRWCYLAEASEYGDNFYGPKKWAELFVKTMNEQWNGHSYYVAEWNDGKQPRIIIDRDGSFTSLN